MSRLTPVMKNRVRGKLPTKRDIVDWGDEKVMQFLRFVDFFTEEGVFKLTVDKVNEADALAEEEPFWDEFLTMIDVYPQRGDKVAKFKNRFYTFTRVPLTWLKTNPHAVTLEMYEIMRNNARMEWASKHFKVEETETGAEIVVMDQDETTDPGRKNVSPAASHVNTPQVQFEDAKLRMATLAQALVKSIPVTELKKMSTKDKIMAFDKLMNTMQKMMNTRGPNTMIFQQINTNKAGKDELEKAMMQFAGGERE